MGYPFSLQLRFRPSFHPSSVWSIDRRSDTALFLEVSDFYDSKGFCLAAEISEKNSDYICSIAERAMRGISNWRKTGGLDGIEIEGEYESKNTSHREFSFWSPLKGDEPHELIDAVFGGIEPIGLSADGINYYEQLRSYFDFGAPIRVSHDNPTIIRISCNLSMGMEEELRKVFAEVEDSLNLVVDMRNFEGMGTMLLPLFSGLVNRKHPTKWLASEAAVNYLVMLKVPSEIIEITSSA